MLDSPERIIDFQVLSGDSAVQRSFEIASLVIAAWAGRDREAVEKHIAELEAEGVPRPAHTPQYYRIGINLLTTEPGIQVPGTASSGEIEAVIVKSNDELWIGAGSDHTDRKLEATSVVMSKQACPKPIAETLWRYAELENHWDDILLRSWRYEDQERILYQEGSLALNLHAGELIDRFEQDGESFGNGTLMFCGTIPTQGGIKFSRRFDMELYDPVMDRRISHTYRISPLAADSTEQNS